MMMSPRSLTAASVPVEEMAAPLSRLLARKVVDQTGLAGKFDIKVEWTPDETQALELGGLEPRSGAAGPSIFTAFQEQLGLKFETQKGPVDILVVTRAEKPSEN